MLNQREDSIAPVPSFINTFTPSSTSSTELSESRVPVGQTFEHNSKVIYEIIDNIFDDQTGHADVSSSDCTSMGIKSSEYSFDKRLQYWRNVLAERKQIEANIKKKTGKREGDMLFNRMVTVDERDKQTVKRLMDYAERLNPLNVMNKKASVLQEYVDLETCRRIHALEETLPQAEREGEKIVEISGLPAVAKEELLGQGRVQGSEKKSQWIKSKVLENRIEEKRSDIERVIEYYPDIEHLQVVGESLAKSYLARHDSDIKFIAEDDINHVSSDTTVCEEKCPDAMVEQASPQQVDYSVKINDQVFQLLEKRSAKNVEVEVRFECEPFEKVVKRVMRIENLGKKVINFDWVQRSYFEKNCQLLKAEDEEFLFQHKGFRLISGESRDIIVQFQPRRVDVVKAKWMLKVDPQFFCKKVDAVVVRLNGKCKPPPEYVEKIRSIHETVIEKSNLKMMRKLTTGLGSITPLINPFERICPYKRTLTDLELFEFYNIGYRCDRYHDLQLLKSIHERAKKPRQPAWDLKLDTLRELILQQNSADQRALLFDEMMGILGEMRGTPVDLEAKVTENPERERTCYVYVRGIICTGIDEWEELASTIEDAFLKIAIKEYYDSLLGQEGEEESSSQEQPPPEVIWDEAKLRLHLTKDLRHRKAFRDTLYMQTYTHLCNFIEDTVSVIESTDII